MRPTIETIDHLVWIINYLLHWEVCVIRNLQSERTAFPLCLPTNHRSTEFCLLTTFFAPLVSTGTIINRVVPFYRGCIASGPIVDVCKTTGTWLICLCSCVCPSLSLCVVSILYIVDWPGWINFRWSLSFSPVQKEAIDFCKNVRPE